MFWTSEHSEGDAGNELHRGNGEVDPGLCVHRDVVMLTVRAQGLLQARPVGDTQEMGAGSELRVLCPSSSSLLDPDASLPSLSPSGPRISAYANPKGQERASLRITSCGHTPSPAQAGPVQPASHISSPSCHAEALGRVSEGTPSLFYPVTPWRSQ